MDVEGRTIWQQAAGDTDRNYARICLNWDVILNGPGYAGGWPECRPRLQEGKVSSRKITDLRRFCQQVKDGDIIVLRLGTTDVLGVGEVVGEYTWMEEFGDVDGWDLQHVRRVRWLRSFSDAPKKFPTYTLKQGDTTQRLTSAIVESWLDSLSIPSEAYTRELAQIRSPKRSGELSFEEISEYLFDQGVASNSIETLMREIDELVRIAKWYKKFGKPSEFETVAYLVVPLLRALGWTPQKMAVEWNHVDLALFSQLPREANNLAVVVEAKQKDKSCLTAVSQAATYAEGRPGCRRLIVTDGLRYGVYLRGQDGFSLHAYMNLTNLREEYPVYHCAGAKGALLAMTPDWRN